LAQLDSRGPSWGLGGVSGGGGPENFSTPIRAHRKTHQHGRSTRSGCGEIVDGVFRQRAGQRSRRPSGYRNAPHKNSLSLTARAAFAQCARALIVPFHYAACGVVCMSRDVVPPPPPPGARTLSWARRPAAAACAARACAVPSAGMPPAHSRTCGPRGSRALALRSVPLAFPCAATSLSARAHPQPSPRRASCLFARVRVGLGARSTRLISRSRRPTSPLCHSCRPPRPPRARKPAAGLTAVTLAVPPRSWPASSVGAPRRARTRRPRPPRARPPCSKALAQRATSAPPRVRACVDARRFLGCRAGCTTLRRARAPPTPLRRCPRPPARECAL
jgi:hypothetical protein